MRAKHDRCLLVQAIAAALIAAAAGPASARQVYSDKTPPLYPQVILRAEDGLSGDPDLAAFRDELRTATEALTDDGAGRTFDPEAVLPFLDDEVEIFVGQGPRAYRQDFVALGKHPAGEALAMLGRLERPNNTADDLVAQRHGMLALRTLLGDPTIGASAWLDGRTCTAAYGKLAWPDWTMLNAELNLPLEEWRIAVETRRQAGELPGRPAPGEEDPWPRKFQLVPVSPEQKRSGGSIGIIEPRGYTVFFDWMSRDTSIFAPYLNNHVCFEKGARGWKVSAFAWRLE